MSNTHSGTRSLGAPARSDAVRMSGVTKQFGDLTAVDDIDLDVREGEIVALIGPSGSGKTTAVRLMTGIVLPARGEVTVWGTPVAKLSAADKKRIGYLPQHPALVPELSIIENLQFHASLVGVPLLRRRSRLRSALELVELGPHRTTRARDASGGMRRRLALAAALIHDPALVFLDEPTAGIDPVLRQQIWEHLAELKASGHSMVVTTQYVGEAQFCDRVAVISDGRLLAYETPQGLRHHVYGGDVLKVEFESALDPAALAMIEARPEVRSAPTETGARTIDVVVDEAGPAIASLGQALFGSAHPVVSVEERTVDFDAMFVELIERSRADRIDQDEESRR